MKKNKQHYVNNKDFLQAMIEYKDEVKEAKTNKEERPIVPTYIGECLMKIAVHLSYKPCFTNYTFKDEMITDGIENCLLYIDNFDPDKSKNPFSYFTQIIYYAFLRRIAKEKKYLYTKFKLSENIKLQRLVSDIQEHDDKNYNTSSSKTNEWSTEYIDDFIENFEENKRKRGKFTIMPVDNIIKDDD